MSVRPPADLRARTAEASEESSDDALPWQVLSIVALMLAGGGIALTGSMDLCGSWGPIVLFASWLIAPVVSLASLLALTVTSTTIAERRALAIFAGLLTLGWVAALMWASVGEAIARVGC